MHEVDADGNGYDYRLQVVVRGWIVERCAHPETMRSRAADGVCCNGRRYAGMVLSDAYKAKLVSVR